jgi:HPt (histidine-containing phosphotransfer) domain-containing protein
MSTLQWIKEEISKTAYFERVVFKQASAAISSNCGPGAFGILYFVKSNKSYNIGSFFDSDKPQGADEDEKNGKNRVNGSLKKAGSGDVKEIMDALDSAPEEKKWYQKIECIDGDIAIKNSGSEDAFREVLKIFYDSIPAKTEEIEGLYADEDWSNYTIKVHALKSSAKLIGAVDIAERAQNLELAGKANNIDYIRENHEGLMKEYKAIGERLTTVMQQELGYESNPQNSKPLADSALMHTVFEELREAAENMDCDTLGEIIKEMGDYRIPDPEKEKYVAICQQAERYDYDKILEILDNK